jgi:hypothetical protein
MDEQATAATLRRALRSGTESRRMPAATYDFGELSRAALRSRGLISTALSRHRAK